jgi:hypothetical protein
VYEYKVESYSRKRVAPADYATTETHINEMSNLGWEFMHSVMTSYDLEILYFRRFKDLANSKLAETLSLVVQL